MCLVIIYNKIKYICSKYRHLKETDFIYSGTNANLNKGRVTWKAPSNIALVKYWGKKEPQLPKNASLSFTLDACSTYTSLNYNPKDKPNLEKDLYNFEIIFDGNKKDDFKPKIATFFQRIEAYVSFIKAYSFLIETRNTFPHSSGIASSASGLSALSLCIMSIEKELNPEISDTYFFQKAAFLARLGSGSATRSVKGSVVVWGEHPIIPSSSDLFGLSFPFAIHPVFKNFHDTILLVDKGEKQISSTVGHNLMQNHPFAEKRFEQANNNLIRMKDALEGGLIKDFIAIVESEALSLHAMMLTSNPYFILMQPNTLAIIQKIWRFRKRTNASICFTLDAGANVHVLYPENEKELIFTFIKNELISYCQNNQYICDRLGDGAKLIR